MRFVIAAAFVLFGFTSVSDAGMFMKTPTHANALRSAGISKDEMVNVDDLTVKWLTKTFRIADKSIAEKIYQSIEDTGGKCPCPYLINAGGSVCGGNSAYSKPGGSEPICYPKDVLDAGQGLISFCFCRCNDREVDC